jgi:hypothetical protein
VGVTRGEGFGVTRPGGDVKRLVVDVEQLLKTSRIQMRCLDLTSGSSQSNSRLGRYSRKAVTTDMGGPSHCRCGDDSLQDASNFVLSLFTAVVEEVQ